MTSRDQLELRIGHHELIVRRRYETLSIANDVLIALWFVAGGNFGLRSTRATGFHRPGWWSSAFVISPEAVTDSNVIFLDLGMIRTPENGWLMVSPPTMCSTTRR